MSDFYDEKRKEDREAAHERVVAKRSQRLAEKRSKSLLGRIRNAGSGSKKAKPEKEAPARTPSPETPRRGSASQVSGYQIPKYSEDGYQGTYSYQSRAAHGNPAPQAQRASDAQNAPRVPRPEASNTPRMSRPAEPLRSAETAGASRAKTAGTAAGRRKSGKKDRTARAEAAHGSKNRKKRTKKTSRQFRMFTAAWGVIYAATACIFCLVAVRAGVLPTKYLMPMLLIIVVVSALLCVWLILGKVHRGRKIAALVMTCVLIPCYTFGAEYLTSTNSFFKAVTTVKTQTIKFYVVVPEDSDAEQASDLSGTAVGTVTSARGGYGQARNHLRKDASKIKFESVVDLKSLGENLLDDTSGMVNTEEENDYDAILVSAANYEAICDQSEDFKSRTKVIAKYKVKIESEDLSKNVDVTKDSFNIYISGLDTKGKISETSRSDVNMIVTVNPKKHWILLTTIPRDYHIRLVDMGNAKDKLTHTGIYGIKTTLSSVEDLTGVEINYYIKVNYTTVLEFIDSVGGIDVNSEYEFDGVGFEGNYHYKKGMNHLNGEQALAFARNRSSFNDGDVQRNRNQAIVMEAILKKATQSSTILKNYSKILNSLKDYMELNFSSQEIKSLVRMQLSSGAKWTIKKQSLTGNDTMSTCYSSGSYQVYVMEPDRTVVKKAVNNILAAMDGKRLSVKNMKKANTSSGTAGSSNTSNTSSSGTSSVSNYTARRSSGGSSGSTGGSGGTSSGSNGSSGGNSAGNPGGSTSGSGGTTSENQGSGSESGGSSGESGGGSESGGTTSTEENAA